MLRFVIFVCNYPEGLHGAVAAWPVAMHYSASACFEMRQSYAILGEKWKPNTRCASHDDTSRCIRELVCHRTSTMWQRKL